MIITRKRLATVFKRLSRGARAVSMMQRLSLSPDDVRQLLLGRRGRQTKRQIEILEKLHTGNSLLLYIQCDNPRRKYYAKARVAARRMECVASAAATSQRGEGAEYYAGVANFVEAWALKRGIYDTAMQGQYDGDERRRR